MGQVLQRHLGLARTLDRGQWTDRTASGRPAASCPDCGQIDEVDVDQASGRVRYIWACPSERCAFRAFLTLEAWKEPVLS